MSDKATCAVVLYRGEWLSLRSEPCGKPSKGIRTTPDDVMWPVCGIHLRAKYGLVGTVGRLRSLRAKGVAS